MLRHNRLIIPVRGQLLQKPPHRPLNLPYNILIRLRPFPQHLRVTLHQIATNRIQLKHLIILPHINIRLMDLLTHAHSMLQPPQPIPRIPLLLVILGAQIMAQYNHRQEQRMRHMSCTRFQMVNRLLQVRTLRPLCEATRHACAEVVGEHELPPARAPLLAHVRLAEDELQVGLGGVWVVGGPEEGADDGGAFDGAEGEVHCADHGFVVGWCEGDDVWGEGLGVLGIFLEAGGQLVGGDMR